MTTPKLLVLCEKPRFPTFSAASHSSPGVLPIVAGHACMWVRLLHFFFGRRWRLLHFFFCASSSATWPSGPTSTFWSFGLLKSCGGAPCEWWWGWCPCCCLSVWLQLGFLNGLRAQRAALFLNGLRARRAARDFFLLNLRGPP